MDLRPLCLLSILGASSFLPVTAPALKDRQINNVALLESPGSLKYSLQPDGLHIEVPAKPAEDYGFTFGIGLDGPAQ